MIVMEELLTVKEVAKVLRLSEEAVRRLLRGKQLRGYTVQNAWRVRKTDIEAYLESQSNMNQQENNQAN